MYYVVEGARPRFRSERTIMK